MPLIAASASRLVTEEQQYRHVALIAPRLAIKAENSGHRSSLRPFGAPARQVYVGLGDTEKCNELVDTAPWPAGALSADGYDKNTISIGQALDDESLGAAGCAPDVGAASAFAAPCR